MDEETAKRVQDELDEDGHVGELGELRPSDAPDSDKLSEWDDMMDGEASDELL